MLRTRSKITLTITSLARADCVIPFGACFMVFNLQCFPITVANFHALSVFFSRDFCCYTQSALVAGLTNESHHQLERRQRHTTPVFANSTKQSVFNGVPFRRSCRVVANSYFHPKFIGHFFLQHFLEYTGTAAIAPSGISENQELASIWIVNAVSGPPLTYCIDRKFWCIGRGANKDKPGVSGNVIYSIWRSNAFGITAEIVCIYVERGIKPDCSSIGKFANQLFFLSVYANNGKACRGEFGPGKVYVIELLVPVWVGRSSEAFSISKERNVVFFNMRRIVFLEAPCPRFFSSFCSFDKLRPAHTSTFVGSPALWASTISRRTAWTFGSTSSFFFRPAPTFRTHPSFGCGISPIISLRPRPTVCEHKPVISASFCCPPRSRQRDRRPDIWRLSRSSHWDKMAQSIACQRTSFNQGAPDGSEGTCNSYHEISMHNRSTRCPMKVELN